MMNTTIHEIRAKLVRDDGSEEHLSLERRDGGIYVHQLAREPYQLTAGQHLDDALESLRWYYADQLWLASRPTARRSFRQPSSPRP
jgi:hypothetical protein